MPSCRHKLSLVLIVLVLYACTSSSVPREPQAPIDNTQFGFIDRSGQFVIGPSFDEARAFFDGLAAVRSGNKWGFVDKAGKLLIKPSFRSVQDFGEGRAFVSDGDKMRLLDKDGKIVADVPDGRWRKFQDGLACADKTGREDGLICLDLQGRFAFEGAFRALGPYSEGLMAVWDGQHAGYLDHSGKLVIPMTFQDGREFSEGLAAVKVKGLWGFVDKTGRLVIPAKFTDARAFSEGFAAVANDVGLWGLVGKTGTLAVPHRYQYLGHVQNGRVAATKGETSGFVTAQGREIWFASYDMVSCYRQGLVLATRQGFSEAVFLDEKGKEVFRLPENLQFLDYVFDDAGLLPVWDKVLKKAGFIDVTGKLVVAPQFRTISVFSEGMNAVSLDGGNRPKLGENRCDL